MQRSLRPLGSCKFLCKGEVLLYVCYGNDFDAAGAWEPWGTAALGRIGEVDCVAKLEEIGCPARAAVGGVEECLIGISVGRGGTRGTYCACLDTTRDEDERVVLCGGFGY